MKRDISQAWQKASAQKETTAPPASGEEARARMIERLSKAWKVTTR